MNLYDHDPLIAGHESYRAACREFEWELPARYNIAADLVETHDNGSAVALVTTDGGEYTFDDVDAHASRIAHQLSELGLTETDRVGVCLPDHPATAFTHIAVYKTGGVVVPLSTAYDRSALTYRIEDSGLGYLITTSDVVERLGVPEGVVVVTLTPDDRADATLAHRDTAVASSFTSRDTRPTDPAVMMYTSGTTGDPKGVVHGHQVVPGYLPGFEMWNDLQVDGDRLFWCPNDWSFTGSLLGHLYPAWHYGKRYLCRTTADSSDPQAVYEVLASDGVTNTFVRPDVLTGMMTGERTYDPLEELAVVSTGGAPYEPELYDWVESTLNATPVEVYGQTEANMFVSECPSWFSNRPDKIGKAVPGAAVGVVDAAGNDVGTDTIGELGLRRDHPVVFETYWEKPDALGDAFVDNWMLTESMCVRDEHGYYEFVARKDDIIAVDGQYVTPATVETAVAEHDAVAAAGVVGGDAGVEAFVELVDDADAFDPDALTERLDGTLPAHAVPNEITVIEELPTTERGKIRRAALRRDDA